MKKYLALGVVLPFAFPMSAAHADDNAVPLLPALVVTGTKKPER